MSVVSNRYANKLFAEHPIALWPLDDDAYFISLISNSNRNISVWSKTNCSINTSPTLPNEESPFSGNDSYYEIVGNNVSLSPSGGQIELKSPEIFYFQSLNRSLTNFSINLYMYQDSVYCESYEFGFRYFDIISGTYKEVLQYQEASPIPQWIRLNSTFDIPQFNSDTKCEIVIKINVSSGGSPGTYNFILHGLSIGQWSEQFSAKSLGSTPETLPSSTDLTGVTGVGSDQYGPLGNNAYYVVENNTLLAKNDGVPIIFGSENCTKLLPSKDGNPSFIFDGNGFFSEEGRHKTFSLEFWMKIKPNTKNARKIFGTVDSSCNYGIYVSEGFITLVVGNNFNTYQVSEWYRPMLINFLYEENFAKILINGEEVIEVPIERSVLEFPSENEWLGFFSYEDIDIFEIDCLSLFSYPIPLQVAKRRMVWGQGVSSQELVDASFKGSSAAISFPNANYASNIIYPDKERWDAGHYNNLVATSNSLSVPQYSLPEIFLGGRDPNTWYEYNKRVNDIEYPNGDHPKFFTFRPGLNESETEWIRDGSNWTEKSYLKFSNTNIANAPITTIYGVFEIEEDISQSRPLIHITNSLTDKRFEINISGYDITYTFDGEELYTVDTSDNEHIIAGFHIPTISQNFGNDISSFFSSYEFLQIYVGGSPDTASSSYETFEGKVYKIGFADSTNYESISDHFNINGFANYDDDSFFIFHFATYTLKPFEKYEKFFLDISISAYWEEYFPLSLFSKYILDADGKDFYGFDFLQFNVDYPSNIQIVQQAEQAVAWDNYLSLDEFYSYPIQKNYQILDNSNITGYVSYDDLKNDLFFDTGNSSTEVFESIFDGGNSLTTAFNGTYDLGNSFSQEDVNSVIDTSSASLNIFATFQLIQEGANQPISSFTNTKELPANRVVDASLEESQTDPYKAYKTKFKIIDDTIIYPPKKIKQEDVALVIHFSIEQDAILSNPLKIRNMEITSQALNVYTPNTIGTKFGKQLYPFVKNGIYLNYKEKNPISIYKKSNPYLYLTNNSGIKILNYSSSGKEYTVAVPVNENKQGNFYIGAVQLFIKPDFSELILNEIPVFEIQYLSETIEFYIERDSSSLRYFMFAKNKNTGEKYINVSFYQNGIKVVSPCLAKDEWASIGMLFEDPLNFSNFSGSINMFAGFYFNNISTYLSQGLNETASIIPNVWQNILTEDNINNLNWGYWYDQNSSSYVKKWKEIYVRAEEETFSLSPADIYSAYLGTNANVIDDGTGISIFNDDFITFSDISWNLYTRKPA